MKKLKLRIEDLTVRSFAAEKTSGAVHAMAATFVGNTCRCTEEVICYTNHCTGSGCVVTAAYGCATNQYGAC
jgi:hypothetical protein